VENAEVTVPLRVAGLNLPAELMGKYPHLFGCTHLEIEQQNLMRVSGMACWHCTRRGWHSVSARACLRLGASAGGARFLAHTAA
jgi:hypothetical protein